MTRFVLSSSRLEALPTPRVFVSVIETSFRTSTTSGNAMVTSVSAQLCTGCRNTTTVGHHRAELLLIWHSGPHWGSADWHLWPASSRGVHVAFRLRPQPIDVAQAYV